MASGGEKWSESLSQLLIHTGDGELAETSRGKVEQFCWLMQADVGG